MKENKRNDLIKLIDISRVSNKAKEEVKKQVPKEVTQSQYNSVMGNLESVLKANERFYKKANAVYKTIKCLEVHNYAPEMNKAHLKNGDIVKIPQIFSIENAANYIAKQELSKQLN